MGGGLPHRTSNRSRLLLATSGLSLCVAVVLASASPGLADRSRLKDGVDASGPLDLADAKLKQTKRKLVVDLRTRGEIALGELRRHPTSDDAPAEPVLCLRIDNGHKGRRLLCPGGESRDSVGVSKISRSGTVREAGDVKARVKTHGSNGLRLRFSPRAIGLRPGTFRWSLLSDWRGAECGPPEDSACFDRMPDDGRGEKFRLLRLQAVGCTMGSPSFARRGNAGKKRVALTFDDGPGDYTLRVLRALRKLKARGTFFVIGQEASGRGALLRKIVKQGHEIANHSMHHETLPSSSSLAQTSRIIEHATGFEPCRFRPPGGNVNSSLVARARSHGMTTVNWDVDPQDWRGSSAGAIQSGVVRASRPGSIVLMHDGGGNRSSTVAALPGIVGELRSRGYRFTTVTKILGERKITKLVR